MQLFGVMLFTEHKEMLNIAIKTHPTTKWFGVKESGQKEHN